MNELALTFEGHDARIVMKDGDAWFVLADWCEVLEIDNPSQVAARLDDDEKGICNIDTPSGVQQMLIVSEPGLYAVLRSSRKPIAKRIDRWLRHDVMPQIRKTGMYIAPGGPSNMLNELTRRVDDHDKRLDQHEDILRENNKLTRETHGNVIRVIEWQSKARLPKQRRFSEEDERICYLVIHWEFGDRCPIDRVTRLTDDEGKRLPDVSEVDHWQGPQYNRIENALPVSLEVHKRLTADPAYRATYESTFRHFHLMRVQLKDQGKFTKPKRRRKQRPKKTDPGVPLLEWKR